MLGPLLDMNMKYSSASLLTHYSTKSPGFRWVFSQVARSGWRLLLSPRSTGLWESGNPRALDFGRNFRQVFPFSALKSLCQDLDLLHDVELLGRCLLESIEPKLGEYGLDWDKALAFTTFPRNHTWKFWECQRRNFDLSMLSRWGGDYGLREGRGHRLVRILVEHLPQAGVRRIVVVFSWFC